MGRIETISERVRREGNGGLIIIIIMRNDDEHDSFQAIDIYVRRRVTKARL